MATQTRKKPVGARITAPSTYQISKKRQRHPVDAAWGWLSSVRTAILLITLITLICFLVSIGNPGAAPTTDKLVARLGVGESGYSFDKQWTVTVDSAKEATVLLVTKDSGSILIWPTAVILILSLCATFYFPQRRIWLRIQGERVQMAALREHFVNIRTDLLGVSRQAGANAGMWAEIDQIIGRRRLPSPWR